jgi:alpha-tubulin suppressor-like RCC1 family protein
MIPNASAARNAVLPPLPSFIRRSVRSISRALGPLAALALAAFAAACTEATSPGRRFPVLDDVGVSDWQSVSVGSDHTCALKLTGNVYCWGSNRFFQLGQASSDTVCGPETSRYGCNRLPTLVQANGVKFTSVSAGARHTCAITAGRDAYCWGSNDGGQVASFSPTGPTLVRVQGSLGWTQISAGFTHTCAVRTDGALYCWGSNDRGQLGSGSFSAIDGLVRVQLASPVAEVSAGQQRTCARTTLGAVYCWGAIWQQSSGGLEITSTQTTPAAVPNAPSMASLSVGTFTTCGADISGFGYCWEGNPRGQMGTGTQDGSKSPIRVASNLAFIQMSAGIVQTCGVVTNGAGYCWGDDTFGQLGVSPSLLIERCGAQTLPCATRPTPVYGRQQFSEISTGFGSHSCGVSLRGNLYCWGLGVSGQRGDGTLSYAVTVPVQVREPLKR